MSIAEASEWRRTSPLAAIFYLGKIYQAVAKNAVQSLAPLAAFLVAFQGDTFTKLVVGIGLFVLATIGHAFLRYWFFRYRIEDDSILMRDGVFNKKQLDIKFERIQGVNTTQNIVFRLFDLVTVNLDTAGSSGQEGYLPAVRRPLADELKERIRQTPSPQADAAAVTAEADSRSRTLLRLTGGDIVRIGLSSGRVFLALVLIGPLSEYLDENTPRWAEESELLQALGAAHFSFGVGLALGLAIVLALLAVLLAASIVAALLRYHRFELVADGDVLRSTGGLLTRHEHSVNRAKVQSLHVIQNFMLRRFRQYRLRARQATSGRSGASSRFEIPICSRPTLAEVASETFGQEYPGLTLDPTSPSFEAISRHYLRSRTVVFGLLPAIVACAALLPAAGLASLLALLWIPLVGGFAWLNYRRYGVAVSKDGLAFRSGFIGYRIVIWLHRKVQRVTVTQSPFQRRRKLATIRFYLAAGSVTIPFIDYAAAAQLRDYVLFRVESSRQAWH